jgi:hypothetical protein
MLALGRRRVRKILTKKSCSPVTARRYGEACLCRVVVSTRYMETTFSVRDRQNTDFWGWEQQDRAQTGNMPGEGMPIPILRSWVSLEWPQPALNMDQENPDMVKQCVGVQVTCLVATMDSRLGVRI